MALRGSSPATVTEVGHLNPASRPRAQPGPADHHRAAGVDLPVLFPMPVGGDWQYDEVISSFAAGAGWPDPGQDGEENP